MRVKAYFSSSLLVLCSFFVQACFALDGEVIQASRPERANALMVKIQPMSQLLLNSLMRSDSPRDFDNKHWKEFPGDRLQMLSSLLTQIPARSRIDLQTLLSDKIIGGKPSQADEFLLGDVRCGGTSVPALEIAYNENKALKYRLLYFPSGVSSDRVYASRWWLIK